MLGEAQHRKCDERDQHALKGDTARAPLYRELLTPLRLALGVR